jgi:hypothetical protein
MNRASRVFLRNLLQELDDRGQKDARALLCDVITNTESDPRVREDFHLWCEIMGREERPVTVMLRDLCSPFGHYWKDLRHGNLVDAIDAASVAALEGVLTPRSLDGRLFPAQEWDTGWQLSLQADKAGYQCAPKDHRDHLEEYDEVEAVIYGPEGMLTDPATLGLPQDLVDKFTPLEAHTPAIGCNLTWKDVDTLVGALNQAGMSPNAGVPRGILGWAGAELWHGTDSESARDIEAHGIRMEASGRGYFGPAFYSADQRDLAASN